MSIDDKSFLHICDVTIASLNDCIMRFDEITRSGCDDEIRYKMRRFYCTKANNFIELWIHITADFQNEKLRSEKLCFLREAIRLIS